MAPWLLLWGVLLATCARAGCAARGAGQADGGVAPALAGRRLAGPQRGHRDDLAVACEIAREVRLPVVFQWSRSPGTM